MRVKNAILLLTVILGAFALFPAQSLAATTTISIQIDDIASSTSLFRLPSLPNTSETIIQWEAGIGTEYAYSLPGGVGGTGGTLSSFHNGDNSLRMKPIFQDPLTVDTYTMWIRTASDTYLVTPFTWNGTYFEIGVVSTSTTDLNAGCSTCTRILSVEPAVGSTVATTTSLYTETSFYVAPEDFANILGDSFLTITLTNNQAIEEKVVFEIYNSGTSSVSHYFSNTTVSGPFTVSFNMHNDYPLIPDIVFYNFIYKAYFATTSKAGGVSFEEWVQDHQANIGIMNASFGSISCEFDFPVGSDDFSCIWEYIVAGIFPATPEAKQKLYDQFSQLALLKPWGYLSHFFSIIHNPATTTIPYLTISFPEESVAYGLTLALPVETAIENSLAEIEAFQPGVLDDFLFYWNTLWYIVFAFWIFSKVSGISNLQITNTYEKSGKIPVKSYD